MDGRKTAKNGFSATKSCCPSQRERGKDGKRKNSHPFFRVPFWQKRVAVWASPPPQPFFSVSGWVPLSARPNASSEKELVVEWGPVSQSRLSAKAASGCEMLSTDTVQTVVRRRFNFLGIFTAKKAADGKEWRLFGLVTQSCALQVSEKKNNKCFSSHIG